MEYRPNGLDFWAGFNGSAKMQDHEEPDRSHPSGPRMSRLKGPFECRDNWPQVDYFAKYRYRPIEPASRKAWHCLFGCTTLGECRNCVVWCEDRARGCKSDLYLAWRRQSGRSDRSIVIRPQRPANVYVRRAEPGPAAKATRGTDTFSAPGSAGLLLWNANRRKCGGKAVSLRRRDQLSIPLMRT